MSVKQNLGVGTVPVSNAAAERKLLVSWPDADLQLRTLRVLEECPLKLMRDEVWAQQKMRLEYAMDVPFPVGYREGNQNDFYGEVESSSKRHQEILHHYRFRGRHLNVDQLKLLFSQSP